MQNVCLQPALFWPSGGSIPKGNSRIAQPGSGLLLAQMLCLEIVVVEAVKQEVHQIRHHGFRSFGFQKLYDMVICQGREFDKDFSYDSYLWLFDIPSLQTVKIADDSLDVPAKLHHSCRALGQEAIQRFFHFSWSASALPGTAS